MPVFDLMVFLDISSTTAYLIYAATYAANAKTCKAGFIAGQLNSTLRRVELRHRLAMNTSTTQLNSTSRCVAIIIIIKS